MKGENSAFVFLAGAGMELGYLYAGATFATHALFHQPFPFPEAVGSFLLAALLTHFADGRGWRVIYVLGIQSLGFAPALLRMVNVFNSWADAFLNQTWFTGFFNRSSDVVEYFVFVLALGWLIAFWAGGVDFARRPKDFASICSRFDRGIIAFFIFFLTKFYLQVVQGIQVDDPMSGSLLVPFLIFSLLAIGLVRNQRVAHRDFIPGFQTIGALLGFIAIVLLAGAGLVSFCLPYLTLAARQGNDLLGIVSSPLIALMFGILTWLFGADWASNGVAVKPVVSPEATVQWSIPWWLDLFGKILASGVAILVALVLLVVIGGLLYSVFLWLFSKTAINQEKPSLRHLLASLMNQARALVRFAWRAFIRNTRGYQKAVHLFTALRTWGRYSGLPYSRNETPAEYGARLGCRFPALAPEIELIVGVFNQEVYGEIVLNEQQLAIARSAWRKLASPSLWRMRLRPGFSALPVLAYREEQSDQINEKDESR